ncbi:MAG: hypothetical protein Q9186_003175 [Xanthomendoza sp. 1 TL-2023]
MIERDLLTVGGFPAPNNAVERKDSGRDITNPVLRLDPPDGFALNIKRTGEGKTLDSKKLYKATLHALLHFSLLSYRDPAELYTTRGPEPVESIVVNVVPFAVPSGYIPKNCHLAWGLYRSVIAFNVPSNVRESAVNIFLHGQRIAKIEYLQVSEALAKAKDGSSNDTMSSPSVSEMEMIQLGGDGVTTPIPAMYTLRWRMSAHGHSIRRETAYDTVAFAILYAAPFAEDAKLQGYRTISFAGGQAFVTFDSNPIGHWPAITWGQAASIVRLLPTFLEQKERFQDAFAQVYTPNNKLFGMVGIFHKGNDDEIASIDPSRPGEALTA